VSNDNTFRATRYLPQAVVATTLVVVLPVLVVWILLADGVVSSPWVGSGLAIVLSFAASIMGAAYWKRRGGPGDLLFSELLLWGWVRRFRSERRLASAIGLLGRGPGEDGLPESDESIEHKSQVLAQIAAALDALDSYTDGHSRRVALHAAMIARKMGLSREDVAKISTAAAVHDVGKLRIPAEVLNKQGRLTTEEFEIVKRHAEEGAEIVSCMEDPAITEMVRHHHERFDGSGYPSGLAGEQIPTGARIIAVADTFDALTSARPYRGAVRHKTALGIIRVVSRTQLDPVAVRAFLKCYSGKRAVLFWTLLAVSPQRALASIGGRSAGRASLGSATAVAMPAALAALVVAAIGSATQAARPPVPLRFAQSQPIQLGVVLPLLWTEKHTTAAHHSRARTGRPVRARQTVLGITTTHTRTSNGPSSRADSSVRSGQSGAGETVSRPAWPPAHHGSGTGRGAPARGGGSKKPPPTRGRRHPPTHATAPPSSSPPPPSGPSGTPGGGGSGRGSGGNQGGNQGGGSGGNQGGGSGGNPSSGPPSKQACFDGGWANYGFPNQGQCVASFEHSLHE
jgi:putative nucleotidyltransferase with HDIG domain